jgi:hypothetical protein
MSEEFLTRAFQAREAYLRQMGRVEDDLLVPIMNPSFLGGPRWPSLRESWRVVRNGPRTIVVSDGLSDPFEGEEDVGFGIEIMAETADPLADPLPASWLFQVVSDVSQQAAYHGGFRDLIDELGVLSMETRTPPELEALANPEGLLGILLGLHGPELPCEWDLPGGSVKLITAKVLTPAELAFIAEGGADARDRLRELFERDGSFHRSSASRPSVV